jgi:hypothetical protein
MIGVWLCCYTRQHTVYTCTDQAPSSRLNRIDGRQWHEAEGQERMRRDDHRFVYVGRRGSRTLLHADVMRSFSWSANVCGRKLW